MTEPTASSRSASRGAKKAPRRASCEAVPRAEQSSTGLAGLGHENEDDSLKQLAFIGSAFSPHVGWLVAIMWTVVGGIALAPSAVPGQEPGEPPAALSQAPDEGLDLRDFRPTSKLRARHSQISSAKFPVVDAHTHFGLRLSGSAEELDAYVDVMNRHNVAISASLDGRLGEDLDEHCQYLWRDYRDRFVVLAYIDWRGSGQPDRLETWDCQQPNFAHRVVEQLRAAKAAGASGLKVFKQLGLGYRNPDGSFIRVDDPRWDDIWAACGELGLVVLIHTADPVAFFDPPDRFNERWEELSRHPEWSFHDADFPTFDQLIDQRNRVIARHPQTKFIAAHVASHAEDLRQVAAWLDAMPNMYVDIASRINELGRQPYSAREFLIAYRDRVLFGTDGPWPEARLTSYWRFMETYDEYFPYSEKDVPPQGLWQIYGVGLPDDVLADIYYGNACRLIPGVEEKYKKARLELEAYRH